MRNLITIQDSQSSGKTQGILLEISHVKQAHVYEEPSVFKDPDNGINVQMNYEADLTISRKKLKTHPFLFRLMHSNVKRSNLIKFLL